MVGVAVWRDYAFDSSFYCVVFRDLNSKLSTSQASKVRSCSPTLLNLARASSCLRLQHSVNYISRQRDPAASRFASNWQHATWSITRQGGALWHCLITTSSGRSWSVPSIFIHICYGYICIAENHVISILTPATISDRCMSP